MRKYLFIGGAVALIYITARGIGGGMDNVEARLTNGWAGKDKR